MHDYDLIVQGGGLTGLALAACLADSLCRVAVLEARAVDVTLDPAFDGRVTAIAFASRLMLERCGAWQHMAACAEPIKHIEVAEAGGIGGIDYDSRDIGDQPMGHIVENKVIRHALLNVIHKAPNIDILAPFAADDVQRLTACVNVRASDGREVNAPVLALCEGRMSRTRDKLGFQSKRSDYEQTAIVCTLVHEHPHDGRAVERFFPDGPFAILPLSGKRSSIVWALAQDAAQTITGLSDDDFAAEVADRFGDRLGEVRLEGPRWHYPLTLITSDPLALDRVALVGDTARGIHPIAGQGWNLALRDVAALAEIVNDAVRLGLDPGSDSCLERYRQWRRFDSLTLVAVTDGINRLFSNDLAPLHMLRDLGLAAVEQIPSAKKLFMSHAMGTLGDLPRMMRGEAL